MRTKRFRSIALVAALALPAAMLSACGSDDSGSDGGSNASGNDKSEEIVIAGIGGWWEGVAVGKLYQHVLEENGYTNVTFKTLDAGPTYQGVADGDVDLFFDSWLPATHEDYWKQFKDDVVDINVWYDKAPLTIAVPSYMDINSIEDLPKIGDKVDWTITGIDSGAGLYRTVNDKVIPEYGLDKYSQPASSGTAMLSALGKAIDNKEPIVVTLWKPHFAYGQWDLKDLKDPKNALGDPDEIHVIGSKDLKEENSAVVDSLSDWKMSDKKLSSLGAFLQKDKYKNDQDAGVADWAKKNPDVVKSMSSQLPD